MKAIRIFCLLLILMVAALMPAHAQNGRKNKRGSTEQGLVNRLQSCLAAKDAYCYLDLWPDLDTLTKLAMKYSDSSSADFREALALQEQPALMMHADSLFQAKLKASFDSLIAGGEARGINWESIIPIRYELVKMRETRDRLYEKLAPVRFVGYIFFVDALTRRSYGILAGDILQMGGAWYGGRLRELYEASTRDEWDEARYLAKKAKKTEEDSTAKVDAVTEHHQEINANAPHVIAERKFYAGMFDNEIPVQLYIRSLKGGCPAGICSWEAIYKFGDQDDYIMLQVTKGEDDIWHMVEVPETGSMELVLKDGVFKGSWDASDSQTGYDVKFTELPASGKKLKRLDDAFEELRNPK